MAGSLNHIIDEDGTFQMDLIENLGDAHEALEECFHVIRVLVGGDMDLVSAACDELNFPDPYDKERYPQDPTPAPMTTGGKDRYAVPL